jgi:hypothetical protein
MSRLSSAAKAPLVPVAPPADRPVRCMRRSLALDQRWSPLRMRVEPERYRNLCLLDRR